MNTNKLFIRILVSLPIFLLLAIFYTIVFVKHFIGFMRWGGELITLKRDERPTINGIYEMLKKQQQQE
jgi:hypothetical protein